MVRSEIQDNHPESQTHPKSPERNPNIQLNRTLKNLYCEEGNLFVVRKEEDDVSAVLVFAV